MLPQIRIIKITSPFFFRPEDKSGKKKMSFYCTRNRPSATKKNAVHVRSTDILLHSINTCLKKPGLKKKKRYEETDIAGYEDKSKDVVTSYRGKK